MTLGLTAMLYAANYSAAASQWEARKQKTGAAMTKPSTALPSLLFTWQSSKLLKKSGAKLQVKTTNRKFFVIS